ncbi:MAG: type II toxin-antitoxin system RelE/ParE family toxin [Acidobacteria bacterium]|nr:type II toxin-antitoxin system RelE/ParE family toxin [Acidobacteriota bacterium]
MSRRFRPEAEASAELEHAALWYEEERPGLGADFLDAVDATLDRIAKWPDAAPRVRGLPADVPARQAPVSGFPYHIAYLVMPNAIRILAFAHDNREPGYWFSRVTE